MNSRSSGTQTAVRAEAGHDVRKASQQSSLAATQPGPAPARASDESALETAAEKGDLEQVRRLVADGARLDAADADPGPLALAVAYRHRAVAEFLVLHGAPVNACDKWGTALHWAAMTGDVELAQFLLDHGADLTIRSHAAGTPLHRAAEGSNPDVADLLIRRGASANAKADDGSTPLMWCLPWVRLNPRARQVVRLLVDHGADVNATDTRNDTPLRLAEEAGDEETIRLLLAHGAR